MPLSSGVLSALPQQKPQLSLNTPYPAQLLQDADPVLRLQVGGRELRLPLHHLPALPLAQPLTVSFSLSQGTSLQLNLSLPTASVTV
ncbi:MAG: flagellar hook-length control protein FliK, partial [Alishewanella aestuarii]